MILQNFDLRASGPTCVMKYRRMLSTKPIGFSFHATVRDHLYPVELAGRLWGDKEPHKHDVKDKKVNGVKLAFKPRYSRTSVLKTFARIPRLRKIDCRYCTARMPERVSHWRKV